MTNFEELDGDYAEAAMIIAMADASSEDGVFYYNEKGQTEARHCRDTVYGPKMIAPMFLQVREAA